jgi:hypothetical protein
MEPKQIRRSNMELINYKEFFKYVLKGIIKLSDAQRANTFASWKVDGQDFYIYGIKKEE